MAARTLVFFVLLLFFLSPIASAGDIRDENIWIYQGSYQLELGGRAELEGFTVKLHAINDDGSSATILVYRNSVFKEAYFIDADANSVQVYENELRITVNEVSLDSVSLEIHKQQNERVWITSTQKTGLKVGSEIEDENYVVKLKELTEEGALISIQSPKNVIENVYKTAEFEKIPDEFMMNVVYINKNTEEVFIETLRPGKPELGIFVKTDEEDYYPTDTLEYQFSLSNDGTVPLHGLILSTSVSEGMVEDTVLQHASLDPTKTKKFVVDIRPPTSPVAKNITITSSIKGYDYKANEYSSISSIEVPIKPYVSIKKDVQMLKKSAVDTEFGTDEYFKISLTVRNMAGFQTALTINDELTDSFIPDNMESPEWVILMEPDSEKTINYHVKPTLPGNFTFGIATAQWKYEGETYNEYTELNEESFQVHGLKATVEKNVVSNYLYPGDETEVIIKITNTGDRQIDVSMSDDMAPELELVSGKTSWNGKIAAGGSKEITYTILALDVGDIYLPAASIEFTDENDKRGTSISGTPILYVDNALPIIDYEEYMGNEEYYQESQSQVANPVSEKAEVSRFTTLWFLTYSFIVLFLIVAIVPGVAYLFINRNIE
jgi:hypothetical protein